MSSAREKPDRQCGDAEERSALPPYRWLSSESGGSRYVLTVGYDTLADLQAAARHVVMLSAAMEGQQT